MSMDCVFYWAAVQASSTEAPRKHSLPPGDRVITLGNSSLVLPIQHKSPSDCLLLYCTNEKGTQEAKNSLS